MSPAGTPEMDMEELAANFAEQIPEFTFSPAEIQGYLQCRTEGPSDAIRNVGSWVENMLQVKEGKEYAEKGL